VLEGQLNMTHILTMLIQNCPRLSVPPKSVVKLMESTSRMLRVR
jgi:hypothetical protein